MTTIDQGDNIDQIMARDSLPRQQPNLGGRPSKFGEPSRPVTMTLPERVLRLLATVDPDRAKAIVKLAEMTLEASGKSRNLVEVVPVSPAKAVILVANSRLLRGIPWLRLVEVAPARYLLSVLPGTSIEKLEVTLGDLLDAVPASEPVERDLLESLRHCLRGPRRNQTVTKEEILFVAMEPGKDKSLPARKTTSALDRVRGRN